ncbi:MAG TPA: DUF222 domain-containing protein, partial [Lacisediminihabitans sp.]|uniref:HNH endonuclease signature motif containing protein n=1 Tax=Lacisediminihabitans sp. TaxID=2787631 RepID=UPI002EDB12BB
MEGLISTPVAVPTAYAMMADTRSELVETVAQFDRMIAQLTGMRAEAIEQARVWSEFTEASVAGTAAGMGPDLGRRSLIAELACAMRMPERTAESLVNDSQALVNDLPATLAALRSGSIGYRHAQLVVDQAAPLEPAIRAELEQAALPLASSLTPSAFDRRLRSLRERMDPGSAIERHRRAVTDRRIECSGGADGMAWLSAYLPVEQAVAIYSRITETSRGLQTAEETRTLTQLRADVLATVLLGDGSADGVEADDGRDAGDTVVANPIEGLFRRIRPRVMVTVPVLTLLGASEQPATLEGYGPIDPETARLLTAEAPSLTRLLTHPETGAVLSVGRDSYRIPARLRTWLRVRDGTCRFPGCGRSAGTCDLDHTLDWQYGGSTDWRNLASLCPKHHTLKHEGGWHVSQ